MSDSHPDPTPTATDPTTTAPATTDPVELELFSSRFTAVAREMGEMLRRTAVSTNVKERLDFSCAVLDPSGRLVVNAPHIPVHLGALGLCVREVARAFEEAGDPLGPGDVAVTNHPGFGGSHLPDVTLITPVFAPVFESTGETGSGETGAGEAGRGGGLVGWVASRAHHAEIGGRRPGSMPPEATSLAQEGVVIPPGRLVEAGEPRWEWMRGLLSEGPWPSRAVEENLADLAAALAANHRGATRLGEMAAAHGSGTVARSMEALTRLAQGRLGEALERLTGCRDAEGGPIRFHARQELDDGTPLEVTVEVTADGAGRARARIDFTGSGAVHPGNLNAPPAVVRSAVLYVLRLLLEGGPAVGSGSPEPGSSAAGLPLNEGLLEPVQLVLPAGSLLNPAFPEDASLESYQEAPAVVGGNVETSQRIVGLLIEALGLAAASQGTMNNVLFGNERFGYYETVCGGAGAGPGFDGASAVHTHMTNTRITDPEVMEHRFPVRLESFRVRRGSGGAGRHRGGDGAVREITFLEPVSLSVLTQHRLRGPAGMAGGGDGAAGRQRLIRRGGETVELGPVDGCEAEAGDRLVLETPGGGGWGEP